MFTRMRVATIATVALSVGCGGGAPDAPPTGYNGEVTLVRAPVPNRRRYFAAYVGGVVFFALSTQWVRVAHPMMYMSWFGLTVVMPLFWLVALAVLRQLDKMNVPLAVVTRRFLADPRRAFA